MIICQVGGEYCLCRQDIYALSKLSVLQEGLELPEDEEEATMSGDRRSLQLREINLDDNGLKDEQFCTILEALNK